MARQKLPKILENHFDKTKIYVFNFKLRLESEYGSVEPDLFTFSADYKYFAIIEAETTQHSLDGHVTNQMLRITNANIDIYKYNTLII